MILVHHLENSRSQRVLFLLEELGLEYDLKHYRRHPKTMLGPESLHKVHPLGKSPIIQDGDRVVAESGAIIDYVLDVYGDGRLVPEAPSDDHLRYRYWMHYAEGSLMPLVVMKLVFDRLSGPPMPLFLRPAAFAISRGVISTFVGPRLDQNLVFIEGELGQSPWFAGSELTAADIQMSFPLEAALTRVPRPERFPKIRSFVERFQALPAYQRALERGGPYAYAL